MRQGFLLSPSLALPREVALPILPTLSRWGRHRQHR